MEMLHYDFMQRAFLAGALIALTAPALGVYLLLRRQALMADMLSHVSLAGIAAGALLHAMPSAAGFAVAVAGAVAVEYVRRFYKTYGEVSVAIIMIGGLSTAVILMSLNKGLNRNLESYLFGSVVAVTRSELVQLALVAAVGLAFFALLRRPLYQLTFDEETARTNGVPAKALSLAFSILTGMVIASAIPIVGVLLVSALIVLPASLAIRIAPGFAAAVWLSAAIGLVGVFAGLTASYEIGTPPGGTISLTLLALLALGVSLRAAWAKLAPRRSRAEGRPAQAAVGLMPSETGDASFH